MAQRACMRQAGLEPDHPTHPLPPAPQGPVLCQSCIKGATSRCVCGGGPGAAHHGLDATWQSRQETPAQPPQLALEGPAADQEQMQGTPTQSLCCCWWTAESMLYKGCLLICAPPMNSLGSWNAAIFKALYELLPRRSCRFVWYLNMWAFLLSGNCTTCWHQQP